ncbi:MAG: hypothetical protein LBP37_04855 [Spirochaetaceae bacterium]|nr:hypothetical protein [Spirochaetaceae bacterium]
MCRPAGGSSVNALVVLDAMRKPAGGSSVNALVVLDAMRKPAGGSSVNALVVLNAMRKPAGGSNVKAPCEPEAMHESGWPPGRPPRIKMGVGRIILLSSAFCGGAACRKIVNHNKEERFK